MLGPHRDGPPPDENWRDEVRVAAAVVAAAVGAAEARSGAAEAAGRAAAWRRPIPRLPLACPPHPGVAGLAPR